MRRAAFIGTLTLVTATTSVTWAQNQGETTEAGNPRASHLAIGAELMDLKSDFGVGLSLTSPYFIGGHAALRAHGGIAWFDGIPKDETEYEWMGYVPLRLGVTTTVGTVGSSRFYAEAGLLVVPPSKLTNSAALGGYGDFGFEFFTMKTSPVTYFLQAGAVGSNGDAGEVVGEPTFANGFLMEVGFRWYPY
jgi:hypothetical protein